MTNKLKNIYNNIKKSGNIFNIKEKIAKLGIKGIKTFIDNHFREKVVPIEGSVLYSDLLIAAEHSGIYIGNNEISNILVTNFAEGTVCRSTPKRFTDKSLMHKKIYVSCNKTGPVGNTNVSNGAKSHIGEKNFYGLIFSNCHVFSTKCVRYSKQNHSIPTTFSIKDIDETGESTIKELKNTARKKLGATKWKLWDWQAETDKNEEAPNLEEIENYWKNLELNEETINLLQEELLNSMEYQEEISDENLPEEALKYLRFFDKTLMDINDKYEEVKGFIKVSGCGYSYNELINMGEDFSALVKEMENNHKIKEVIEKLGNDYISEEKKLRPKVLTRSNNEIMGIHKSNDLVRILPSELVNLESEELEYLFYSKYLENSLLTYEIISKEAEYNSKETEEYTELENKNQGPVIACLDTSGSMNGIPILRAKALLLTASKILKKEKRSLYVLLFGSSNQIKELNITDNSQNGELIRFLNSGFGGGTDFETPIKRGIEIIKTHKDYNKADILMITDGYCGLSSNFLDTLNKERHKIDFSVYTIICNSEVVKDTFSDEVINI